MRKRLLEATYAITGEVPADSVDIKLALSGEIDHQMINRYDSP